MPKARISGKFDSSKAIKLARYQSTDWLKYLPSLGMQGADYQSKREGKNIDKQVIVGMLIIFIFYRSHIITRNLLQ